MRAKFTNKNNFLLHIFIHIILGVFSVTCILPILLIVVISVTTEKEIYTTGYTLLPKTLTTVAYEMILSNPAQLLNSYAVTIGATLLAVFFGLILTTTMGYVISRRDYRLKKQLSFFVFFTMLFNGGLVPSYILISKWLHMRDSYLVLFIPGLIAGFHVLLMKGFIQNFPVSLIEATKMDGGSEFRILFSVVLPNIKPALATVGLFIAFGKWNDWVTSFLYIQDDHKFMLQYLLIKIMNSIEFMNSDFARNMAVPVTEIPSNSARMAMCVLAAGPMLVVFPFFQRYFVKGLTLGSIKG